MGNVSLGVAGSSYYELARNGQLFCAYAIVTAPVIYTTAAGTGGPLLWNGSTDVNAVIIGVNVGVTVVSTVASNLGLTGGVGQTSAPTSTTAIDAKGPLHVGGPAPKCNVYRVGTPSAAGSFFMPLANLGTGALTVDNMELGFTDLQGMIVVPPNGWVALAASATASTTVAGIGLIWAELPV